MTKFPWFSLFINFLFYQFSWIFGGYLSAVFPRQPFDASSICNNNGFLTRNISNHTYLDIIWFTVKIVQGGWMMGGRGRGSGDLLFVVLRWKRSIRNIWINQWLIYWKLKNSRRRKVVQLPPLHPRPHRLSTPLSFFSLPFLVCLHILFQLRQSVELLPKFKPISTPLLLFTSAATPVTQQPFLVMCSPYLFNWCLWNVFFCHLSAISFLMKIPATFNYKNISVPLP